MERNQKDLRKKKTLFKSYYCVSCKQAKPCQLLTDWDSEWKKRSLLRTFPKNYCCWCYYQSEQEKAKEYSDYQQVYQRKVKERQKHIQQLQLLREYSSCKKCGSKEVDAYSLYENSQLVCQPCRMKKEGGSSGSVSFLERQKWYKRYWKVELTEWLESYDCLPVNAECAKKWLKDKKHLENCDCLEREVRELVELFSGSLQRYQDKLAKCACKTSQKIRVDSDYYAWCERCQEPISVASKKRVIKNRNDPRFWGLNIREKVLCLECLGNLVEKMPVSKKYTFNKYLKRGY